MLLFSSRICPTSVRSSQGLRTVAAFFLGQQILDHGAARQSLACEVRTSNVWRGIYLVSAVMEWCWSGRWSGCQEAVIRLSSRSFRNSSPPQLECKQPYSCTFLIADCLPAWLAACRAANENTLGPRLAITVGSAGRLPGICMAWPDLGLVSCSRRRLRRVCLVGLLSGGCSLLHSLCPCQNIPDD